MFACIYFNEDASLSVVGRRDPDLKILGNFNPREKVEMRWKIKANTPKVVYHGTIIKVGEKEDSLVEFANKAYSRIIKKEKEELKGKGPPDSLFDFEIGKQSIGKRQRIETERVKESKRQEETLSPKKRKKKEEASAAVEKKSIKKIKKISTESEINKIILSSQFEDISGSSSSDDAQSKTVEKTHSAPLSGGLDVRPKIQLEPIGASTSFFPLEPVIHRQIPVPPAQLLPVQTQPAPFPLESVTESYMPAPPTQPLPIQLTPPPQMMAHGTSSPSDRELTSLSKTWALCRSTLSDNVGTTESVEQPPQHLDYITIPAPSPEVLGILRGLLRQDVQDYIGQIVGKCSDRQLGPQTFQEHTNHFVPQEVEVNIPQDTAQQTVTREEDTHIPQIPVTNCQQESSTKMAKLLDYSETKVSKDGLRKAASAALKSNKPGYTLCYKLLTELFSIETLAASRGQGIGNPKDKEKPVLDKEKTQALKNYVVLWCKKHGLMVPSEQLLNGAITERISYARKQCSKASKKD